MALLTDEQIAAIEDPEARRRAQSAAAQRRWRQKYPDRAASTKMKQLARAEALRELARRHPEETADLYLAALVRRLEAS